MVTATFKRKNSKSAYSSDYLWQYDYGQVLRIKGLDLPTAVEVHFSVHETKNGALPSVGHTKDGCIEATIPNELLVNNYTDKDYNIYAFVYLTTKTSGQTEHVVRIRVKSRPKLESFEKPQDVNIFRQAIEEVGKASAEATQASDAANKSAVLSTQNATATAQDAAKTAEDRKFIEDTVSKIPTIPTELAQLRDDANHRLVTDDEKMKWNGYGEMIPREVEKHNVSSTSHADIRQLIADLKDKLNTIANSDDVTLDQMQEIVAYIKNNKTLIDSVTTSKVNVSDVINNLTTTDVSKPLSANMGVELKKLIDAIVIPTKTSELVNDSDFATKTEVSNVANAKVDKNNPNITGTLNMNRKANSTTGDNSIALGRDCIASGQGSLAVGLSCESTGKASAAFGQSTMATANFATAHGINAEATNGSAFASGCMVKASGDCSFATGHGSSSDYTEASGKASHATGLLTKAVGAHSHTEGSNTKATSNGCHAEGLNSVAGNSELVGDAPSLDSQQKGSYSHAEGIWNLAKGTASHAEGYKNTVIGGCSHVEGEGNIVETEYAHVEGRNNIIKKYAAIQELVGQTLALSIGGSMDFGTFVRQQNGVFRTDKGYSITASQLVTKYLVLQAVSKVKVSCNVSYEGRSTLVNATLIKKEDYRDFWSVELDEENFNKYHSITNTYSAAFILNGLTISEAPAPNPVPLHVIGDGIIDNGNSYKYAQIVGKRDKYAYSLDWDGNASFSGDVVSNKGSGAYSLADIGIKITGKLDNRFNSSNAGKVLSVGDDGYVTPADVDYNAVKNIPIVPIQDIGKYLPNSEINPGGGCIVSVSSDLPENMAVTFINDKTRALMIRFLNKTPDKKANSIIYPDFKGGCLLTVTKADKHKTIYVRVYDLAKVRLFEYDENGDCVFAKWYPMTPDTVRYTDNLPASEYTPTKDGNITTKKYVDDTVATKLDKAQGSANANKNVVTDASGNIIMEDKPVLPTALSQLTDDATHRTVTDVEKQEWNSKANQTEVTQLKENLKEYVKADNGVINADKVLKTDGMGKVVFGDMPQTTVDSVALNQMLGEVLV